MTNFINTQTALNALKQSTIKISQTKTGEAIQQTQRNNIGAILRSALFEDLAKVFPISDNPNDIVAYLTADGIVLEVPNESVADGVSSVTASGAISLEIGFTVKSLEYNAKDESEAYKVKVAEKEAKAKTEAEKKAKRIEADKKARAEKPKRKEG